MLASLLGNLQNDIDAYNEEMGQTIGLVTGAVILGAMVWLIRGLANDDFCQSSYVLIDATSSDANAAPMRSLTRRAQEVSTTTR